MPQNALQKTLVIIKPDGVKRSLIGQVISRLENAGLKIIGIKMMYVDRKFAKTHYSAHVSKPFYKGLEDYIVSGPVVAMVIEGIESIEVVRKIVGSTEPKRAAPGTIRGDFAHHSTAHADVTGKSVENLIHASGTVDEAEAEIKLWFKSGELQSYKTVHEEHTF